MVQLRTPYHGRLARVLCLEISFSALFESSHLPPASTIDYPLAMDLDSVQDLLSVETFEPLRILLASGTYCDVHHPDSIFIHDRQLLIIDRIDLGASSIRSYRFVDPQLVKDVVPVRLADVQSSADELSDREIITPAARMIDWIESLLALLATALICLIVAFSGVSIYLNIGKAAAIYDVTALLTWAVLIAIEMILLVRFIRFYERRLYPLPLFYALAYDPPTAGPARLALAVFWLMHATAGVLSFAWAHYFFYTANLGRPTADHLLDDIVLLIFISAGAHASMTFFLLTARSAGATPRIVRNLWRFRVLIDLFVVGSVLAFPEWILVLLRPLNLLMRNLQYLIGR